MIARPRIRQLGLGELLDETFRLYRNNFLVFVGITSLIFVPYSIVNYLLQVPLQLRVQNMQSQFANPSTQPSAAMFSDFFAVIALSLIGSIGLTLMYVVLFQPLMEGALAHAVSERYLDRDVSILSSVGAAFRRILALIGARLLPALATATGTAIFLGMLLGAMYLVLNSLGGGNTDQIKSQMGTILLLIFCGFGILLLFTLVVALIGVRLLFTSQAAVVEGQGPWSSIKRSWNLTQGYFWRTLGYLIVIALLGWVISGLPALVVTVPVSTLLQSQPALSLLINTIVGAILQAIVTPFTLIAFTLMYYDLRIRKEGFDLERLMTAMQPPEMPYTVPGLR